MGTTALRFEPPGDLDLSTQRRIWQLARQVEDWPEIKDVVPGVTNLMLVFATPLLDLAGLNFTVASNQISVEDMPAQLLPYLRQVQQDLVRLP